MRENQKSGLTPIIRDEDGTIIGSNPLFTRRYDLQFGQEKSKKQASDRITAMPSEPRASNEWS